MSRLRADSFLWTIVCVAVSLAGLPCGAGAQIAYPEKEVVVRGMPQLTAASADPTDVLKISLAIVIGNKGVCCGKDSALEDSAERANPKSLKEIAEKLKGRHLLSDGRPIMVTTEFLTAAEVNAGHIIYMLQNQHAPLMEWNSQVYVVRGVTYVESEYNSEGNVSTMDTVHTFLLEDVRYSDAKRRITFDRTKENAGQVGGFLFVGWKTQ